MQFMAISAHWNLSAYCLQAFDDDDDGGAVEEDEEAAEKAMTEAVLELGSEEALVPEEVLGPLRVSGCSWQIF